MNFNSLSKSNTYLSILSCFILLFVLSNNSFAQGFQDVIKSGSGVLSWADIDNSQLAEDFIWILDRSSWTNGSNAEKMRLSSTELKLNVSLRLTGTDLILDNSVRRNGAGGTFRRAFVHDGNDMLTINYQNDYTGGVTIGSDLMRLMSNGNVGIGTNSPQLKFDVRGNGSKIGLANGAAYDHLYMFHDGATAFFRAGGAESGLAFQVNGGGSTASYDGQTYIEAMRLLGNGNVGIGTTTPAARLDVNGQIKISGGSPGTGKVLTSDATGLATWTANTSSQWTTNETNVYYNGGNIGIGTTTPNAPLQFANTVANRKIVLYEGQNNDFQFYGFGAIGATLRYNVDGTGSDHAFFAGSSLTSANELMRIKGNGNVGIGTATPTEKLHVAGNLKVDNHWFWQADKNFYMKSAGDFTFDFDDNDGNDYWAVWAPTTTEILTVRNNGKVGIGTTSPTAKLHVNGDVRVEGNFSMAATPTFSIDSASVVGGRFLVNSDGRIGMGVPASKLENKCKLSINGPTYIGDFGAGYNSDFVRDSLIDDYFLWVEKGIVSEDFAIAEVTAWDDYVFNEDYQLSSLQTVEAFITANKHLPNIPSEAEVKKDGYSLHKLNRGLLKTIEEQTLHAIRQEKKISTLENKVTELEAALNQYKQLAAEVAALKVLLLENASKK